MTNDTPQTETSFERYGGMTTIDLKTKSRRKKNMTNNNHSPKEQTKSEHLKVHKDESSHTNNGETLCSTRLLGVTRKNKTAPADTSIIDAWLDENIYDGKFEGDREELKQRIADVLDDFEKDNTKAISTEDLIKKNIVIADYVKWDKFRELKQKLIGGKRT